MSSFRNRLGFQFLTQICSHDRGRIIEKFQKRLVFIWKSRKKAWFCVASFWAPLANIANRKRYRFGKPRNHNGYWVFSCHFSKLNSKDIISQKRLLGRTWTKYLGFLRGGFCDFFSQSLSFFVCTPFSMIIFAQHSKKSDILSTNSLCHRNWTEGSFCFPPL